MARFGSNVSGFEYSVLKPASGNELSCTRESVSMGNKVENIFSGSEWRLWASEGNREVSSFQLDH